MLRITHRTFLLLREEGLGPAPTAQPVGIQIVNQGEPKQSAGQQIDPKTGVVSIFLKDMQNNGPMAQSIQKTFELSDDARILHHLVNLTDKKTLKIQS